MVYRFAMLCATVAAVSIGLSGPSLSDDGADAAPLVKVFKSPACGCCTKWADHLEENGFRIEIIEVADIEKVKRPVGVPEDSHTCHTAIVEGYTIEGHVPASDIQRLLEERPAVDGLVVPGMPIGSPGMESPIHQPYTVYTFDDGKRQAVFSRHK